MFRRHDDLPGGCAVAVAQSVKNPLFLPAELPVPAADLEVVMDRCLKIEHARFHGGLHLAGFDTGVISSKRCAAVSKFSSATAVAAALRMDARRTIEACGSAAA